MDNIYVGKITTTHGIKGELKVRSDFKYKDEVFVPNMTVIVNGDVKRIVSSRNHQEYKLILFEGLNNINDVLMYKGMSIYINRSQLPSSYILNEDIIGFDVIVGSKNIGKLDDIIKSQAHEILVIGKTMIPYVDAFINRIDFDKKQIFINDMEGLL